MASGRLLVNSGPGQTGHEGHDESDDDERPGPVGQRFRLDVYPFLKLAYGTRPVFRTPAIGMSYRNIRSMAVLLTRTRTARMLWGVEGARQITIGASVTPRVAVVTRDLLDRTRIEEAVRRAGLEPVTLATRAAVERALADSVPGVALVDLRVGEGERIVGLLAAAGVEVTVFGPHVDEEALERARAAGAAEALPRSRFFTRLTSMFEA